MATDTGDEFDPYEVQPLREWRITLEGPDGLRADHLLTDDMVRLSSDPERTLNEVFKAMSQSSLRLMEQKVRERRRESTREALDRYISGQV